MSSCLPSAGPKSTRLGVLLLVAWLASLVTAGAEPLTISYFERPPYYFTSATGDPDGLLIRRTRQILQQADIEARFVGLTPYRILYVLRHATLPHCSVGWFRNSAREQFAQFSQPIYQDKPLMLLTSKKQQEKFNSPARLRDVFADRSVTLARMGQFSYGGYVDDLLGVLAPKSIVLTGKQSDLLQAIGAQRASYMLVSPEELAIVAREAGFPLAELLTVRLSDVPTGNQRYLMCSQAVSVETMEQLNRAITGLTRQWSQQH